MSWFIKAASTSIGKKQCMAVTGLLLCGFLVLHLAGNFLLIAGPEKFNAYAHWLERNPLLIPAEIGLLALFSIHILLAFRVTLDNRRARPTRYAVNATGGERTLASATMWLSGLVTLVFLVLHLIHFRFAGDAARADLYDLVVKTFQKLPYTVWYVVSVCILGLHVSHGFESAIRTLGFDHPKYRRLLRWLSRAFGLGLALGYAALPLWAYFSTGNPR